MSIVTVMVVSDHVKTDASRLRIVRAVDPHGVVKDPTSCPRYATGTSWNPLRMPASRPSTVEFTDCRDAPPRITPVMLSG